MGGNGGRGFRVELHHYSRNGQRLGSNVARPESRDRVSRSLTHRIDCLVIWQRCRSAAGELPATTADFQYSLSRMVKTLVRSLLSVTAVRPRTSRLRSDDGSTREKDSLQLPTNGIIAEQKHQHH